jgi:hypothetical protein
MTSASSPKSNKTANATNTNDADAPFMGTPYIIDMQRPYEYPFPSPATESCPSLLLPYTHSAPLAHYNSSTTSSTSTSYTGSATIPPSPPPPTSIVHRTSTIDSHGYAPYPISTNHPPMSFRPSTLLKRRSSHRQETIASLSSMPVPIPPRLLARDLPPGLVSGNGRWRKGRSSVSETTQLK